ncbi:MAG: hypothetical protein OER80_01670 [Gammaproteobacteria bacterium]|nr:hypothetical protein [Gammaproteobacteria bacterium]
MTIRRSRLEAASTRGSITAIRFHIAAGSRFYARFDYRDPISYRGWMPFLCGVGL